MLTLPTHIEGWVSLVQEGEKRSKIPLSEEEESYTVFMLMRNVTNTQLFEDPVAIILLHGLTYSAGEHAQALHSGKAGDVALIIAGLYPDYRARGSVSDTYFTDMSKIAYTYAAHTLARMKKYSDSYTYATIAQAVPKIKRVLSSARDCR